MLYNLKLTLYVQHALLPCSINLIDRYGLCSGERPFRLAIVDQIIIPAYVPPGKYVLGFRWDCEETAQIWSTCSDIEISV